MTDFILFLCFVVTIFFFMVRPDLLKEMNATISLLPAQQAFWRKISNTAVRAMGAIFLFLFGLIALQMVQKPTVEAGKPVFSKGQKHSN